MLEKHSDKKIKHFLYKGLSILLIAGLMSGNTAFAQVQLADSLATQSIFKTVTYTEKEAIGKIKYFLTCVSKAFLDSREMRRDFNIDLKAEEITLDLQFSKRQYPVQGSQVNKKIIIPCVLNGKEYYSYISLEGAEGFPSISVVTKQEYAEALDEDIFFSRKRRQEEEKDLSREESTELVDERNDINDDNLETTAYQIIKLSDGTLVQFGVPTETTKELISRELLGKQQVPDIFVLPNEFFYDGRNYADLEFVIYYNFYFKQGRRITIVGTDEQIANLKVYMQHSLHGPDMEGEVFKTYDKNVQKFLKTAFTVYSETGKDGEPLGVDAYINFATFNHGKTNINGTCEIRNLGSNTFSIKEKGTLALPQKIRVDYSAPSIKLPTISLEKRKKFLAAQDKSFAITPMGTSHGFDLDGDFTSFIIWLDGIGMMVDPSPQALEYIDVLGIDDDIMPYVYLTHTHADHDGGLLRKILSKKRIKLLASRPVYDSFISKAQVLVGSEYNVKSWIDYIEVKTGKENMLEVLLPNGNKVSIQSRYNLHSIPTNGFKLTYKGVTFGYSGDIEYSENKITKLLDEGRITEQQAQDLLYFFWDSRGKPLVDMLFHEAGLPPIHTPTVTIEDFSEKIKERTYLVHIADKDVPKGKGLNKAEAFETYTLIGENYSVKEERIKRTIDIAFRGRLGITKEQRELILRKGAVRTYESGKYIIKQGDTITKDSEYYMILSGNIEFYQDGTMFGEAGRGASFGEIGLVQDIPQIRSVITKDNVTVLCLNREEYFSIFPKEDRERQSLCEMKNLKTLETCFERLSRLEAGRDIFEDEIGKVPYSVIKAMTMMVEPRKFKKGEIISSEKEEEDVLYILKSGSVDIFISELREKCVIQSLGKEGDLFGGRAFVADNRKYENVEAAEDTEVLVLTRRHLVALVEECPGTAYILSKLSKMRGQKLERAKNGEKIETLEGDVIEVIKKQLKNAANEVIRALNNLAINTARDKRILIALDDELAGNFQNINLTKVITAVMDILDSKECPDIIKNKILVIRGRGFSLTDEVLKYTSKDGHNDVKIEPANVIMVTKDSDEQKARCSALRQQATITFVDERALDEFSYYPFLEVVFYTLARALHNKEINGYTKDFLKEVFTSLNADILESMEITDNIVVIRLNPIKPEDYNDLSKVYDRIRAFLLAA